MKIPKPVRYLVAGGLGAAINLGIYVLLLEIFHVWYLLASIIAFCLAIFAGFNLQKYWTFQDDYSGDIKNQAFLFLVLSLVNLVINVALLAFFVERIGLNKILAKALTLGIIAVWSYAVYQKLIFVKKPRQPVD